MILKDWINILGQRVKIVEIGDVLKNQLHANLLPILKTLRRRVRALRIVRVVFASMACVAIPHARAHVRRVARRRRALDLMGRAAILLCTVIQTTSARAPRVTAMAFVNPTTGLLVALRRNAFREIAPTAFAADRPVVIRVVPAPKRKQGDFTTVNVLRLRQIPIQTMNARLGIVMDQVHAKRERIPMAKRVHPMRHVRRAIVSRRHREAFVRRIRVRIVRAVAGPANSTMALHAATAAIVYRAIA